MENNGHGIAAQQPEITACHDPDASTSGKSEPLPGTAQCCIGRNKACISNQVTILPPRRRQPHRVARLATSWSPRPPSASPLAGRSCGAPGPARSVTSTRIMPPPALTATVTVSPGAAEPECRTELPKASPTSKTASASHGCPGPSTSETNERAARARSARPASVTLSLTVALAITAPSLPRPPRPRETSRAAGGRRDMHAQLSRERQAEIRAPGTLPVGAPAALPLLAFNPWAAEPRSVTGGREFRRAIIRADRENINYTIPFGNGNNIDCDAECRIIRNGEGNGTEGKCPARR
jgi:hypothetical protein